MTAPFALLEDYIEAFGNASTEIGDTDMQVRAALAAACEEIRQYCAQNFTLIEDDEIVLHGTGRSTLLLPELPVVAVNSVLVNAGEDTEEEVTDFRIDTESGLLWRPPSSSGSWPGRWPVGFLNITVDYDHGYTEVPKDVINVACLMARNSIMARDTAREVGITSETIAGYSYTTDSGSSIVAVEEASRKNLRRILDRYRLPRIPVA